MKRKESEKERGLEIGGRDREGIERWSAKRVFTLQRNPVSAPTYGSDSHDYLNEWGTNANDC